MKKYSGRKQYTKEEAEGVLENTAQLITTNRECIWTWEKQIREGKIDKLIEILCKETTQEMIYSAEEQNKYLLSKMDYMYQFSPDHMLRGSFGIPVY